MTTDSRRMLVLLRGVNVGGKRILPMAELRDLFQAELGCSAVETYIQSGNLVCSAPVGLTSEQAASAIEARFGFTVPVVLRTLEEFSTAVRENPFTRAGANEALLHVVFLDSPLPPDAFSALRAKCVGEEQMAQHGRELFLLLPEGFGRSKLAASVTAAGVAGNPTVRNWKTVLRLQDMLAKRH